MVPRSSDRISRVPPYLIRPIVLPVRGCHPLWPTFPDRSGHILGSAGPRSLAATGGVSIDVLSSGYLDVSVPRVCSFNPMYSDRKYLVHNAIQRPEGPKITKSQVGCPIRKSRGRSLFSAHPRLSQSITSFIASYCQGIHQTPLSRLIRSRRRLAPPTARPTFCNRPDLGSKHTFPASPAGSPGDTRHSRRNGFWSVYLTWIVTCRAVEPQIMGALPRSA